MTDDRFTLPSAEEIIGRLRTVIDQQGLVQDFYPRIAAHAGQQKTREGIEMIILLAISDYAGGYPEAVTAVLDVAVPRFTSVLIEASAAAPEGSEPPYPVPAWATDGLPQGGGTGPRGASVNTGASFSNGPDTPKLIRLSLPPVCPAVTRFALMEGERYA